eukprot:GHVS01037691.1.p1 GENE.GHVS01037691.1~~GHVS01037691.1.p1  ORF type:complete len:818 (+),score=122.44 GHVS01037691.1:226-2679(+)
MTERCGEPMELPKGEILLESPTESFDKSASVLTAEPTLGSRALQVSSSWCLCFPPVGPDQTEELSGPDIDLPCRNRASAPRESLDLGVGVVEDMLSHVRGNNVGSHADPRVKNDVVAMGTEPADDERDSSRAGGGDMVLISAEDVHSSLLLCTSMLQKSLMMIMFVEEPVMEQKVTEEVLPQLCGGLSDATPQSTAMDVSSRLSGGSLTRSVDVNLVPISKVRIADVEKVVQLHFKRLDDYYDCERLFMAGKYLEHLQGILRYNTEYWEEFSKHLKVLNSEGLTSYNGAVGAEECKGILSVLEKYTMLVHISPAALSDTAQNSEHLTAYELLTIKIKLALKQMSFFYLDHLKAGCLPSPVPPGVRVHDGDSSRLASTSATSPCSLRNQPDQMTPHDYPPNAALGIWTTLPPPLPRDGADAALRPPDSQRYSLTSNTVLLMLLKGNQEGAFVQHASLESPHAELEAIEAQLPVVDEMTANISAGDAQLRPAKSKGSWGAATPLRNLSKRMSSGMTRRGVSRRQQSDKQSGGTHKPSGSSIGKMGSKMLYTLTHHHNLHHHHGTLQKRATTEDADSWIREKTKFLDLWYRTEKDTSISIKVRGKLSCALFEVLAIFNETDLAGNWAPMFKSATKEHQMSRASQLVRQVFDYPMLGQKESIMYCFGVDALVECGCVMIFCMPPPELSLFFLGYRCPAKGKMSRVQSATMCFLLFPISQGRQTTLELYANFIHGMRFVPSKLIAYLVKKVVKGMFVSICKQCQNFSESVYAERVKSNPEFYDWMRDTIAEFCTGGEGGDLSGCRLFGDAISLASFDINEFE